MRVQKVSEDQMINALEEADNWYLKKALRNYSFEDANFTIGLIEKGAEERGILANFVDDNIFNSFSYENREQFFSANFTVYLNFLNCIQDGDPYIKDLNNSFSLEQRAMHFDPVIIPLLKIRGFVNDVLGNTWIKGSRLTEEEIDKIFVNSFNGVNGYINEINNYMTKLPGLVRLSIERGEGNFKISNYLQNYWGVMREPLLYQTVCILRGLPYGDAKK